MERKVSEDPEAKIYVDNSKSYLELKYILEALKQLEKDEPRGVNKKECSINIDYKNCSSKDHGMSCNTCVNFLKIK